MSEKPVLTFTLSQVGAELAGQAGQTNAGAYAGGAVPIQSPSPHLAPTAAGTVTTIVGALRVMLPPGDATERLVLMVTGLPEQAKQEVAVPIKQCPVCGSAFTGRHPAAIYCSDHCGNKARGARGYIRRRANSGD